MKKLLLPFFLILCLAIISCGEKDTPDKPTFYTFRYSNEAIEWVKGLERESLVFDLESNAGGHTTLESMVFRLSLRYKNAEHQRLRDAALAALSDTVEVTDYPQEQYVRIEEKLKADHASGAEYFEMSLEEYASSRLGMTLDGLYEKVARDAERKVKREVAVYAVAWHVGIMPLITHEVLETRVSDMMKYYEMDRETLLSHFPEEQILHDLVQDLVLDYLVERAK